MAIRVYYAEARAGVVASHAGTAALRSVSPYCYCSSGELFVRELGLRLCQLDASAQSCRAVPSADPNAVVSGAVVKVGLRRRKARR